MIQVELSQKDLRRFAVHGVASESTHKPSFVLIAFLTGMMHFGRLLNRLTTDPAKRERLALELASIAFSQFIIVPGCLITFFASPGETLWVGYLLWSFVAYFIFRRVNRRKNWSFPPIPSEHTGCAIHCTDTTLTVTGPTRIYPLEELTFSDLWPTKGVVARHDGKIVIYIPEKLREALLQECDHRITIFPRKKRVTN